MMSTQRPVPAPPPPRTGPLAGVRIVEFKAIGPVPFCAMLLADLGATVLRIERRVDAALGLKRPLKYDLELRSREAIALDLKEPQDVELALELVANADALIEGFRPGVMERLGLGPEVCLARQPRLVYGRVTGWGQDGPLAHAAGHDLNYIALTGALSAIGNAGAPPTLPLNLLGDYAGGSLYLALGVLAAIIEARSSGAGQVVDSAIVDGTASLSTLYFGMLAAGMHKPPRGTNVLDGGSHFYGVYRCADGEYISVAPVEPKFYLELLERLGIEPASLGEQRDPARWAHAKGVLAAKFATRTRADWAELLEGTDACFAPVLDFAEAPQHPQLQARGTFVEIEGVMQPAPAPRFSRTPSAKPTPPVDARPDNAAHALNGWLAPERIAALIASGFFESTK